jgi:hypothetical protein
VTNIAIWSDIETQACARRVFSSFSELALFSEISGFSLFRNPLKAFVPKNLHPPATIHSSA